MFKNARFALVAAVFTGLAMPSVAQDASTIIARVGETEITLGHVIAMRQQLPQQFAQVPNEQLLPALVQQLVEQELLAQTQADNLNNREMVLIENQTRAILAAEALQASIAAQVTDEAIQAAYDAFVAEFNQGEPRTEYHAAHILVRTEEERDQVVAALAEGREFGEVAGEFSIDGSSRQGGDLGWFAAGVMIPDFQAAVEALEPGQVSDPVQTQFGWHVIKLEETRDASAPALDDVRDELVSELQQEAVRGQLETLRAATAVEDLSEGLDPALLSQFELLDE